MPLAIPLIHAIEVSSEESCLIAARTGTDLHNCVAIVVGISRKQQLVQLGGGVRDLARESREVFLHHSNKLGVRLFSQALSLFELLLQPCETIGEPNYRNEPSMFPAKGS